MQSRLLQKSPQDIPKDCSMRLTIAPPGGWRDPRPVTSSSVAFGTRESTAVGTVGSDAQCGAIHARPGCVV